MPQGYKHLAPPEQEPRSNNTDFSGKATHPPESSFVIFEQFAKQFANFYLVTPQKWGTSYEIDDGLIIVCDSVLSKEPAGSPALGGPRP